MEDCYQPGDQDHGGTSWSTGFAYRFAKRNESTKDATSSTDEKCALALRPCTFSHTHWSGGFVLTLPRIMTAHVMLLS